ncbi:hypothetical protein AB1A64_12590 [Ruegeria sp. ANG10]|uniref:hypothetical protein n=1 Tax=Ruegeria sp. ANG10 TaxID=3042467 RepID=UPI003456EE24
MFTRMIGLVPNILNQDDIMKIFGLILTIAVLAACEPSHNSRPEPEANSGSSGVSISGYGRVGVSVTN